MTLFVTMIIWFGTAGPANMRQRFDRAK